VAVSGKAPRRQHGDTKPKIIWTPEELIQSRAVADEDDWATGWRLTLCGLRRSEVLGLKWEAVDLARGEVVVQAGRVLLGRTRTATDPKSSASHRTVPVEEIHRGTVALLRSLKARQAADRLLLGAGYLETCFVLVDPLGEPVKPYTYSDRFEALCRQAGVPVVQLHSVRHTSATIMHKAGTAPAKCGCFARAHGCGASRSLRHTHREGHRRPLAVSEPRSLAGGELFVKSDPSQPCRICSRLGTMSALEPAATSSSTVEVWMIIPSLGGGSARFRPVRA
jgi:integrase